MIRTRRYVVSVLTVVLLAGIALVGLIGFDVRPKLGLDLQGGLSVVLTAEGDPEPGVLDQTVEIIRNRVDSIGAQEPDISRAGEENIIVQLPGIDDPQRALDIIGTTAQLRFREVLDVAPVGALGAEAEAAGHEPGSEAFERFIEQRLSEQGFEITEGDPLDEEVTYPSTDGAEWYRLGPAEVVGDHVGDAFAQPQELQGWAVNLELTGEGRGAWADVTTRLAPQQGQLAIVLDRRVESAPVVQQPITDGRAQITGQFTDQEARDLALVLRAGALPVELTRSQVRQVSATLGTASLQAGLIAGAIGLALVALYMLAFYRLLGLITLVGLGLFAALVLGVIGVIGVTRGFSMTLAGIAGLIVSVGIAADSYIIYYERVKDELKEGKTFRSAVDRGFTSAFRTNLAGNSVAFAAALILWWIAIGPVRGFALTLGISVVLDVGMLYFYTHPVVALMARRRKTGGLARVGMHEVVPETDQPQAVPAR